MNGHVRRRSPGSFELRWRQNEHTRTTTIRTTSKRVADARLRELMVAADRGEHVEPSRLTVAQLVAERIEAWHAAGRISLRTAEHYRALLAARIVGPFGEIRLQKLTTLDIETWHATMAGLSSSTIKGVHSLLSRTLADAMRHGLLSRNVAQIQRPPKAKPADEVEIVVADQVGPMLTKLAGSEFRSAAIVALYTGLRRGEQLALRWANVDLDRARLHVVEALEQTNDDIRVKTPKTAAGRRTISLPDIVVTTLRAHRREQLELSLALGRGRPPDDALVFPAIDGSHQNPRAWSRRWVRTVARLGLPAVHWHALRHTHASMLIAAGIDVVTVSRRLGHAKPDVTLRVYSHLFAKDDAAAAAAINAALSQ